MAYLVFGNLTYSTTANRNTAQSAITTALSAYSPTNVSTMFTAGINTNGTTGLTVSVTVADADGIAAANAFLSAWTSATRATTGQIHGVVKT